MTLSVRDAGQRDLATLVDYQLAMARESEDKGLDETTLRSGVHYLLGAPAEGLYLLAERDGRSAGSLMLTFEWSEWRNGRFWWIQSVYVPPEHRRTGVYSALHAAARERARQDPQACGLRLYVERDNSGAIATYQRIGMVETPYRLFEELF